MGPMGPMGPWAHGPMGPRPGRRAPGGPRTHPQASPNPSSSLPSIFSLFFSLFRFCFLFFLYFSLFVSLFCIKRGPGGPESILKPPRIHPQGVFYLFFFKIHFFYIFHQFSYFNNFLLKWVIQESSRGHPSMAAVGDGRRWGWPPLGMAAPFLIKKSPWLTPGWPQDDPRMTPMGPSHDPLFIKNRRFLIKKRIINRSHTGPRRIP